MSRYSKRNPVDSVVHSMFMGMRPEEIPGCCPSDPQAECVKVTGMKRRPIDHQCDALLAVLADAHRVLDFCGIPHRNPG